MFNYNLEMKFTCNTIAIIEIQTLNEVLWIHRMNCCINKVQHNI